MKENPHPKNIFLKSALIAAAIVSSIFAFQSPAETSALINGLSAFRDKKYEQALMFLEKAERENPGSGEALYYAGPTLFHLNRYADAIAAFRKAEKKDPALKDQLSSYYFALSYYRMKLYCQAQKQFNQAVKFDPRTRLAEKAVGYSRKIEKSYAGGLTAPTVGKFQSLGMELLAGGNPQVALDYFLEAECLTGRLKIPSPKLSAEILFFLAEALLQVKEPAAVLQKFSNDDIQRKIPEIQIQMARAYLEQGDRPKAFELLTRFLREHAENRWAAQARQLLKVLENR